MRMHIIQGNILARPIEALHCLLFHGDGGHIGGQNCIESMEAALQYGRHHHGKSKQRKASIGLDDDYSLSDDLLDQTYWMSGPC